MHFAERSGRSPSQSAEADWPPSRADGIFSSDRVALEADLCGLSLFAPGHVVLASMIDGLYVNANLVHEWVKPDFV